MLDATEVLFWILLTLVFYTYLGYGLILGVLVKIKEWLYPSASVTVPTELPEVVLLVAAWNEEDVVDEKIANSFKLNYPKEKLKLLWVTDGSTDNTNEKIKQYLPEEDVLFEPQRRGKTAALNRAMNFVDAPIVVFSDANTFLNKECIMEIVKAFSNPQVGCVAGEKRIFLTGKDGSAVEGEGLYWKYESTLKNWDGRLYSAMGAAGELYAVRTSLFEKLENDTLLDDFMLSMQIVMKGYKIDYCRSAYAIEGGSASMKDEGTRKVRIAAGGWQSIWRLRRLLNPFYKPLVCFQFVSHRVLRWSITPIAMFLLIPLNILLVMGERSYVFVVLLFLQIIFYILGFCGKFLSEKQSTKAIFNVPYYFLFMNINVLKGIGYLLKKQRMKRVSAKMGKVDDSGAWERAKRVSKP